MKLSKKLVFILLVLIILFMSISPVTADNDLSISMASNKENTIEKGGPNQPLISAYSRYVNYLSEDIFYSYDRTQARYLQKELNAVMGCELDTDGIVGSATRSWIRKFQKAYGLKQDGLVGRKTRNYLNVAYKYQKVLIKASSLKVRKKATTNSPKVGQVNRGDILSVIKITRANDGTKWYKIVYDDGVGYISGDIKYTRSTFVEVDIVSQTLRLYVDCKLYLDTPITTGKKGSYDTEEGYYEIMFIDTDRYLQPSNSYVDYWMRFNNAKAQGLHDAAWREDSDVFKYFGGTVYKSDGAAGTKFSGSKGCVNIPPRKMPIIFQNAGLGTPVCVH